MERNANAYYELVAAAVEAFNERIQCDQIAEGDDYHDALHEVVDNCVPHYYTEIFTVMAADGIHHEFEDSGMMPESKDVTRIMQARIYEALYNDVQYDSDVVWYEDEDGESDEEFWVLDVKTRTFALQGVTFDEAKTFCDERYELGQCYWVENLDDEIVYYPANKESDDE